MCLFVCLVCAFCTCWVVCLFVCLPACLLACLFVYFFCLLMCVIVLLAVLGLCYLGGGVLPLSVVVCLFVCLLMFCYVCVLIYFGSYSWLYASLVLWLLYVCLIICCFVFLWLLLCYTFCLCVLVLWCFVLLCVFNIGITLASLFYCLQFGIVVCLFCGLYAWLVLCPYYLKSADIIRRSRVWEHLQPPMASPPILQSPNDHPPRASGYPPMAILQGPVSI